MKIHATIESERGKKIAKSGNHFLAIEIRDETQKVIAKINIFPKDENKLGGRMRIFASGKLKDVAISADHQ